LKVRTVLELALHIDSVVEPGVEELDSLVEGFDLLALATHKRHRTSPLRQPDFDSGDKSCIGLLRIGTIGQVINIYCQARREIEFLIF